MVATFYRSLFIALLMGSMIHTSGCSKPAASPSAGPSSQKSVNGKGPTIEIDQAVAGQGLKITEKSRAGTKIVFVVESADKDHESGNYTYTLYDQDGAKLDSTGFSIPAFKQGESYEWELVNEDLPRASRLRIHPFGSK